MKQILYTKLNDVLIEQVKKGEHLILTAKDGEPATTLIPLDDLETLQYYQDAEDRIDRQAVWEARGDDDAIEWDEVQFP